MRPSQLLFGSEPIPFRFTFSHAAANRDHAENVLVAARDQDGNQGLGEGCPRDYVTREDVPGALEFLRRQSPSMLDIADLAQLKAFTQGFAAVIDTAPSAFCAVELALIDLFARQAEQDLESFLGIDHQITPLKVSAVYGSGGAPAFHIQSTLFGLNAMRDSKLKLSGDREKDMYRAKLLARRGRLRLDANNLWPDAEAALPELALLAQYAWAVEEPIEARDWQGLERIARETDLAIILDESLVTSADLSDAPRDVPLIPNLRVSKLGGLLRSLEILSHTKGRVIIGAQVGETSILARAGVALARAAGERVCGVECAYGPLLLSQDVARPSVRFGVSGHISSDQFVGEPGLGLEPTTQFVKSSWEHRSAHSD